ncbi:MAG: hypothetical protein HWE24_14795 [Oceanospirillaceae bacterium]|nr:hypothetical protein [Oceanospirillaceae bacterium]
MTNIVLEMKEWYSIDNVCRKLDCDLSDILWLMENKRLYPYTKFNNALLLAYKDITGTGYYAGKAQARYSGYAKINSFDARRFIKNRVLSTSSLSILSENELKIITTDDTFEPWIYNSHIKTWQYIKENENFLKFEYCKFPEKVYSAKKYISALNEALEKHASGLNDSSSLLLSYQESLKNAANLYSTNTNLILKGENILFNKNEIEQSINRKENTAQYKYPWFMSAKRKDGFRKVIDLLVQLYPKKSSFELWTILENDWKNDGELDPDGIVDEIDGLSITLNDERVIKKSNFDNKLSSCKRYYKIMEEDRDSY